MIVFEGRVHVRQILNPDSNFLGKALTVNSQSGW